jgi:chemotaxis-related protein WspB
VLALRFQLGANRYAMDTAAVAEVLPLLAIHPAPSAGRAVAGFFNYRGRPVPAVDLRLLTQGQAAERRLNTRIVLLRCADGERRRLLGVIAEQVTATRTGTDDRKHTTARQLSSIAAEGLDLVHWIDPSAVLAAAELPLEQLPEC